MHSAAPLFALILLIALSACRAADPASTTPTTAPATLTAKITISFVGSNAFAQVKFTNNTDKPLSLGAFNAFTLTRTDTTPPSEIAATPKDTMHPHFRVLMKPAESRSSSIPLWESPTPLANGKYHVTITYPPDVYPTPLETDFTLPQP